MTQGPTAETIRRAVTVPVPVERAFAAFTELASWWPRQYICASDVLETLAVSGGQRNASASACEGV